MADFNPNTVPIPVTFNYQQINLILEALGKMPLEKVETIYNALRNVAVSTLQNAELSHRAAMTQLESAQQAVSEVPQQPQEGGQA